MYWNIIHQYASHILPVSGWNGLDRVHGTFGIQTMQGTHTHAEIINHVYELRINYPILRWEEVR